MVKEITIGVEFHDHFGKFVEGLSGILRDFPAEVHLPSQFAQNYVETAAFKTRDGKLHVAMLPSRDLLLCVAAAVYAIKQLDGTPFPKGPLPHQAVQEDDGT